MKFINNKLILATALTAGLGLASTNALSFEVFKINEDVIPSTGLLDGAPFDQSAQGFDVEADEINGQYVEVVTFSAADISGAGTFETSIKWEAGQYTLFNAPQSSRLGDAGSVTVLPGPSTLDTTDIGYGMYVTFLGSGTYQINPDGSTSFMFTAGDLEMFIDENIDTTFGAPGDGSIAWTTGVTGDDILIGTGSIITGEGLLDPSLVTCDPNAGNNCGSFGTITTFDLTAAGESFFYDPDPFYNISFQSGQLQEFIVADTQTIGGSLNVAFDRVPEPSSLALLGAGLIGFGLSRKKAKA